MRRSILHAGATQVAFGSRVRTGQFIVPNAVDDGPNPFSHALVSEINSMSFMHTLNLEADALVRSHGLFPAAIPLFVELAMLGESLTDGGVQSALQASAQRNAARGCNPGPRTVCQLDFLPADVCDTGQGAGPGAPDRTPSPTLPLPPPDGRGSPPQPAPGGQQPQPGPTPRPAPGDRPAPPVPGPRQGQPAPTLPGLPTPTPPPQLPGALTVEPAGAVAAGTPLPDRIRRFKAIACHQVTLALVRQTYDVLWRLGRVWRPAKQAAAALAAWIWICELTEAEIDGRSYRNDDSRNAPELQVESLCANKHALSTLLADSQSTEAQAVIERWLAEDNAVVRADNAAAAPDESKTLGSAAATIRNRSALAAAGTLAITLDDALRRSALCGG